MSIGNLWTRAGTSRRGRPLGVGWALLGLSLVGAVFGKEAVVWHADRQQMDAQVESRPLGQVLEDLASATRWQVYVEPDLEVPVSARFKGLPSGEALRLLLGELNFALLPQADGPAKLLVFQKSLHHATRLVRPRDRQPPASTAEPIPDELIVRLKDGAATSIEALAEKLGATVVGKLDALDAYRLKFKDEAAANAAREALANDPNVAGVGHNYLANRQPPLDPLAAGGGLPPALKPTVRPDGSRIVVGVIDTAVQPASTGLADFLLPAISVAGDAAPPADLPTHGTAMAETLFSGLARSSAQGTTPVRLLPVDVYGNSETTTTFDIARGIYLAIESGATIINLSLGSEGQSDLLHAVIQSARAQGVLFLAAAGNEPSGVPHYPAAYPEVIAVTAGDRQGNLVPYANRGDFVDVVGPATSIIQFNDARFLVTGTSAATAYVSGMAAALKAEAGKSPEEIEALLRANLAPKPPPAP